MLYKWYALVFILVIFLFMVFSDLKSIREEFEKAFKEGVSLIFLEVILSAIIGFIVSAFVFYFVSSSHMKRAEKDYEVAWRCSIVSLSDNNQTFVSRYSSTSKIVYNYAVQEQLGKTPYHIESNGGDVSIDDSLDNAQGAEITCYRYDYKDKVLKEKYWDVSSDIDNLKYVFTVPKGSFSEKFEVDMK